MPETAAYVVRQSQGTDDSVSLNTQREEVGALARDLADEVELIDLGNYTGFSHFERGPDEERLNDHQKIQQLLEDLEGGRYDYLCALDDTRLARDQFLHVLLSAALEGDCEVHFVRDVDLGELSGDVKRAVEKHIKKDEIAKAKEAHERWAERADHQGRPPKGLQYGPDGQTLVPDEEFDAVCDVLDLLDEGASFTEIEAATGVPTSTVGRIRDRRETYEAHREAG